MNQPADGATVGEIVLKLERQALDRWGRGDPDGFLLINTPDVSYFDPFLDHRLDGLTALTTWFDGIRGKIKIDRDEIINPRVQVIGDAAILTFQFVSQGSEGTARWNATEVYQRLGDEWRIAHSHWSFIKPAVR